MHACTSLRTELLPVSGDVPVLFGLHHICFKHHVLDSTTTAQVHLSQPVLGQHGLTSKANGLMQAMHQRVWFLLCMITSSAGGLVTFEADNFLCSMVYFVSLGIAPMVDVL